LVGDKLVKYPICCGTSTGCFGCGLRNEIEPLGLGVVIYLKLLKAFSIIFFLILLVNIPLLIVYISNKKDQKPANINDALFRSTIGNIASGKLYPITISLS
jgi:hypothetical protein